jgi:hypothetical protein
MTRTPTQHASSVATPKPSSTAIATDAALIPIARASGEDQAPGQRQQRQHGRMENAPDGSPREQEEHHRLQHARHLEADERLHDQPRNTDQAWDQAEENTAAAINTHSSSTPSLPVAVAGVAVEPR